MRKTNYHWFLKTSIQMMKSCLLSRGYPLDMIRDMKDDEVRAFYDSGFLYRIAA